ncbi:MAG: hypothetical protein GYB41_10935 [Oceanospirillales bacterium]|nr:hypothetical protein [Oceanospirillales bacterium]
MKESDVQSLLCSIREKLDLLEREYQLETEEFSEERIIEEIEEGRKLDEIVQDELTFFLPRCEEIDAGIKISDIDELIKELGTAELFEFTECISDKRCIVPIQPIHSESMAEFYAAMRHIENHPDGAFKVSYNENGTNYHCRVISGFIIFGVMVAVSGNYDKYLPPISHDDIFIEITSDNGRLGLDKARQIYHSYIFELSSSMSLDFSVSPRPQITDEDEELYEERLLIEKFRPLISGKGLSEPLELYAKAIESPSYDISILYFTKVLEFISQTVIRIQLTDKVRAKLLSSRALDPSADFIKELENVFELNKIFKKERDAIKITIATCCDASELNHYIPGHFKKIWYSSFQKDNYDKALEDLAHCMISTRNCIAHAKANYSPTGIETPEAEYDALSKCMKMCSQQAIRWYASRHESQRIF